MGRPTYFTRRGRPRKLSIADVLTHMKHIEDVLNTVITSRKTKESFTVEEAAMFDGLMAEFTECMDLVGEMALETIKNSES